MIGGIVALAAVLNGWGVSSMGWGNSYYSAAVRSMGSSWHNFFYASLDSGGYVSVDKPPFSLWVQVLSSKVFGYSRYSLLLPEVVAGAAAVWLLWWGLRRTWGSTAALVGAAALAVMPINVVVNHSNNTDSVLVLMMTAAAVAAMEAVRSGRLRWLVGSCVLAGCAMTAKMLAAGPVMPGLLIAFVWCAPLAWKVRVRQVVIGAVVMGSVGLWWFVAVQATGTNDRPYVGSTRTNSVFELAFERNGVNQVEGQGTGAPIPRIPGEARPGGYGRPDGGPGAVPNGLPPDGGPPGAGFPPDAGAPNGVPPDAAASSGVEEEPPFVLRLNGGRPGSPSRLGFTSGDPGIGRLVDRELGGQVGWLVPLAAIGFVAALIATRLRPSPRLGAVLVLGCWFGAGAIVFSFTKGIVHPYYLAGIGPPLAGLVGIGAATFRFDLAAGRWRSLLGVGALAVTAITDWVIWQRVGWRGWFGVVATLVISIVVVGAVVVVALARRRRVPLSDRRVLALTAAAVAAVLLAPAMWLQGSLRAGVSGPLPYAQPLTTGVGDTTANQITPNGGFEFPSISVPSLISYMRANRDGERWALAVESAAPAEEIIISQGDPVMAIGGFIGTDPIITSDALRERVRNGEVRFFLLSASTGGLVPGLLRGGESLEWVVKQCPLVPVETWDGGLGEDTAKPGTQAFPGGPTATTFRLYDCKGAV
jgi:4-amino-4-deoxy-L-arabinose transferase-like glycosyltransferase